MKNSGIKFPGVNVTRSSRHIGKFLFTALVAWNLSASATAGIFDKLAKVARPRDEAVQQKYRTVEMIASYRESDRRSGVHYFERSDRYEIIFDASSQKWHYRENFPLVDGNYYYFMNAAGGIFAFRLSDDSTVAYQHSSLPAGRPVAGVGLIVFEHSRMKSIDRCSGHYRPSQALFAQVLTELAERRMSFNGVFTGASCY